MPAPSLSSPRRQRRTPALLALLLLFALPLLSACQQVRVNVAMGVAANDRVTGQIIAATDPQNASDKGPQMKVPSSLASKVRTQPYSADGFVGTQAYFSDLTFGEVSQLSQLTDQSAGSFQLQFQRAGDLVTMTGKVDLRAAPTHGTDVQFKVAFPARVGATNGDRETDKVISWKLTPGDITTIRAEVRYADPSSRAFAGWVGIVYGGSLGVVVLVAALAFVTRPDRPGPGAHAAPRRAAGNGDPGRAESGGRRFSGDQLKENVTTTVAALREKLHSRSGKSDAASGAKPDSGSAEHDSSDGPGTGLSGSSGPAKNAAD